MESTRMDARPGRIAVTGADGQLGRELCRRLGSAAAPLSRSVLDITSAVDVPRVLAELAPAVVINCAAWTAVDAAERDPAGCFAANAGAVAALAAACRGIDALFVQISSDYVFGADASRRHPYREADAPGPLGVYGRSKLAGEIAAQGCPRHLIVRTCGLYSVGPSGPVRGRCFADTMLVLSRERDVLRVVDDQHCTPSYVPHVAEAILALVDRGATGTVHVTNSGATTWHGFAAALFEAAGVATPVERIPSSAYPLPAARPPYSVLDLSRLRAAGVEMPDWRAGMAEYLSYVNASSSNMEGDPCVQSS